MTKHTEPEANRSRVGPLRTLELKTNQVSVGQLRWLLRRAPGNYRVEVGTTSEALTLTLRKEGR